MTPSLHGKSALVTGGAGGIGSAVCRLLAAQGARVMVADLAGTRAQALAAELRAKGADALAVQVDLADEGSIQAMVATTVAASGDHSRRRSSASVSSITERR